VRVDSDIYNPVTKACPVNSSSCIVSLLRVGGKNTGEEVRECRNSANYARALATIGRNRFGGKDIVALPVRVSA